MYSEPIKVHARFVCLTIIVHLTLLALFCSTASAENASYDTTRIESDAHQQYTTDESRVVWPWKTYKTSYHTPPHLDVTERNGKLAKGYYFLSPSDSNKEDGTYEMSGTGYIMDHHGDLIFAGEETAMDFCDEWIAGMTDFRAQVYNGRKHITYWNGCNTRGSHWGHRWGRVRIDLVKAWSRLEVLARRNPFLSLALKLRGLT